MFLHLLVIEPQFVGHLASNLVTISTLKINKLVNTCVICIFKPTGFRFPKNMHGTERCVVLEEKYVNVNATFRDF
jgi:hypothetical protein